LTPAFNATAPLAVPEATGVPLTVRVVDEASAAVGVRVTLAVAAGTVAV